MPLQPGTRLGPYDITAALGAGGMGEVHRARDSRLGRDVAIEVTCFLPLELSTGPRWFRQRLTTGSACLLSFDCCSA